MKEPVKTVSVPSGTRVYYIDTFTDRKGDGYVTLSEIPTDSKPGKRKRQRVFIHRNHLRRLIDALVETEAELTKFDKR